MAGPKTTRSIELAFGRLEGKGFTFVPVDRAVAGRGAEIRARYRLKLPDALIAATALVDDASCLVTRDKKMYAKIEGLHASTPEELGYR